jgi:hypothetical protein
MKRLVFLFCCVPHFLEAQAFGTLPSAVHSLRASLDAEAACRRAAGRPQQSQGQPHFQTTPTES